MIKEMILKALKDALDQDKDGDLDAQDLLLIIQELVTYFMKEKK